MEKVTKKQFTEAMIIVNKYCDQIKSIKINNPSPHEIGARVKLSSFGAKHEFIKRKKECIGTVIDWIDWCSTRTYKDGLVTVKWDGIEKPETMHISHIELNK